MIKIRLQGTKNDIRWLLKVLGRDKRMEIKNTSIFFDNKGTKKNKRLYTEIYRKNEDTSEKKVDTLKETDSAYFGTGRVFR